GPVGCCFEVNAVRMALLRSLGFEVECREAIVGERTAFPDGEPTNHLALVVRTAEGAFIVDARWGAVRVGRRGRVGRGAGGAAPAGGRAPQGRCVYVRARARWRGLVARTA